MPPKNFCKGVLCEATISDLSERHAFLYFNTKLGGSDTLATHSSADMMIFFLAASFAFLSSELTELFCKTR